MSQTITAPMPLAATDEVMITGTLVDTWGRKWPNATVNIFLTPPQPASNPYLWQGRAFSMSPTITADSNGYFFYTLPPNSDITPAPNKWRFVVRPANAPTVQPTIFDVSVTAATDISSAFTTASSQSSLGTVQALALPVAPQDSAVATPPNAGAMYYNSTTKQIEVYTAISFGGTGWQAAPGIGMIGTIQDMNGMLTSGVYFLLQGISANGPSTVTNNTAASLVEVFVTTTPLVIFQRLVCPLDSVKYNSTFHRVYNGGWSSWFDSTGTLVP